MRPCVMTRTIAEAEGRIKESAEGQIFPHVKLASEIENTQLHVCGLSCMSKFKLQREKRARND